MASLVLSIEERKDILLFALYAYRRHSSRSKIEMRELALLLGNEYPALTGFTAMYEAIMRMCDERLVIVNRQRAKVTVTLTPYGLDLAADAYYRRMAPHD